MNFSSNPMNGFAISEPGPSRCFSQKGGAPAQEASHIEESKQSEDDQEDRKEEDQEEVRLKKMLESDDRK